MQREVNGVTVYIDGRYVVPLELTAYRGQCDLFQVRGREVYGRSMHGWRRQAAKTARAVIWVATVAAYREITR